MYKGSFLFSNNDLLVCLELGGLVCEVQPICVSSIYQVTVLVYKSVCGLFVSEKKYTRNALWDSVDESL